MLQSIISVIFIGFVTGALARFALPGPDPMPMWLTIVIGITGTLVGAGIAKGNPGFPLVYARSRSRSRRRASLYSSSSSTPLSWSSSSRRR